MSATTTVKKIQHIVVVSSTDYLDAHRGSVYYTFSCFSGKYKKDQENYVYMILHACIYILTYSTCTGFQEYKTSVPILP
jgi:hypothetical protein